MCRRWDVINVGIGVVKSFDADVDIMRPFSPSESRLEGNVIGG